MVYLRSDIHVFCDGARRILFFPADLRFFEIDHAAEAVLEVCEGRSSEEIVEILAERWDGEDVVSVLEEMEGAGIIRPDPPSPQTPDSAEALLAQDVPVNVTLHVSHACNLKCAYCFAEGGAYGGKAGQMKPEVARRAVDWILGQCRSVRRSHINFMGGEPLLNFSLIKEIVAYARERARDLGVAVTFGITTNGTLLSEDIIRFLVEEDVQIMISIDGPRQDESGLRLFHDGSSSYGVVAENARRMIAERPDRVTLRATLTSCNMDWAGTAQHLSELGETGAVLVGMVNESPDKPWAVRAEHLPAMRAHLRELRDYCVERIPGDPSPPGFGSFEGLLLQLLTRSFSRYGCSGGRKMLSVAVDGSIYFCSSLVGREEFHMGDVSSDLDAEKRTALLDRLRVASKAACRACWARHLCGGGCAHDAALTGPDSFTPNPVRCDIIRTSYELAMGMCLDLEERYPGWLERRFSLDWDAAGAA